MEAALKNWAALLKGNTYALYLASRDPRVTWLARAVIALVIAYALNPIDLIPDFVPIIGYLDDLVVVHLGILIAIRLVPELVGRECQLLSAQQSVIDLPANWRAAAAIAVLWLVAIVGTVTWMWPLVSGFTGI